MTGPGPSDSLLRAPRPRRGVRLVLPIAERRLETPSTVTLRVDVPWVAQPGQYVMVWVPGDDELPMSLSYGGPRAGVTVKTMGATSRHIQRLAVGDLVGIRGPYALPSTALAGGGVTWS